MAKTCEGWTGKIKKSSSSPSTMRISSMFSTSSILSILSRTSRRAKRGRRGPMHASLEKEVDDSCGQLRGCGVKGEGQPTSRNSAELDERLFQVPTAQAAGDLHVLAERGCSDWNAPIDSVGMCGDKVCMYDSMRVHLCLCALCVDTCRHFRNRFGSSALTR